MGRALLTGLVGPNAVGANIYKELTKRTRGSSSYKQLASPDRNQDVYDPA